MIRDKLYGNSPHSFFVPLSVVRFLGCDLDTSRANTDRSINEGTLVSSLETTNPMLFHADTCVEHQLPININGHPFYSSTAREMKKVAEQRGYQSLYWLPHGKSVLTRFGVTASEDAPRVVVSSENSAVYYVNADETTNPKAFNRETCFDYHATIFPFPSVRSKEAMNCALAAMAALAQEFTEDGQYWLRSEMMAAKTLTMTATATADGGDTVPGAMVSSYRGLLDAIASRTFPRGISCVWLDPSLFSSEQDKRLVLGSHDGAFIAPGGYVNAADVNLPPHLTHRVLTYAPREVITALPFSGPERVLMATRAVLNGAASVAWGTKKAIEQAKRSVDPKVPPVMVPEMGAVFCVKENEKKQLHSRNL